MMKTYQSYNPSDVFWYDQIPQGWSITKNKFILKEQKDIVDEDWTQYQLLSLTKVGVIVRDLENSKGKFPEFFNSYKIIRKNDLIFCLYDIEETPRTIGLSGLDGMITGSYNVFQTNQVPKFIYYWYLTIDDVKGLKPFYTGMRNVVRNETFMSLKIFTPPLQEQQQIVKYLDEKTSIIDKLISTKERKIELLKEQRSSLINEVITKGLDPNVKMKDSGVEWIGEIPERWGIIPIRYLGTFQNGISKGSEYFGKGFPFMNYGDVYKYETTPDKVDGKVESSVEERERYSVIRGDIFFTRTSESKDDIGVSSVCLTTIKDCSFSGFVIRYRFHDEIHLPEFSKYHFQTYWKKVFIESKMNIVTRSSLSQQVLGQLPILIPNIDEQRQIVEYLDKHTKEIDVLVQMEQKKIELLKEYRQSLISEVITGKIKVVE